MPIRLKELKHSKTLLDNKYPYISQLSLHVMGEHSILYILVNVMFLQGITS